MTACASGLKNPPNFVIALAALGVELWSRGPVSGQALQVFCRELVI
jgi:hypothetical protein